MSQYVVVVEDQEVNVTVSPEVSYTATVSDLPVSAGSLPVGGTDGQILRKFTNVDYAAQWVDAPNSAVWGNIAGTLSNQTDLQTALDGKQAIIGANNNQLLYYTGGLVEGIPSLSIVPNTGGLSFETNIVVEDFGSMGINFSTIRLRPSEASPSANFNIHQINIDVDDENSGFAIGTGGNLLRIFSNNVNHQGSSDIGDIVFMNNNFSIGNGTDPIEAKGAAYAFGFGTFNANVTITGPVQGYGFQIQSHANAIWSDDAYVNAFYDFANIGSAMKGYQTFAVSPTIAGIKTNSNYNGFNINPLISEFQGNAGANIISISGNYSNFDTGGFNGFSINPIVDGAAYANGLVINMSNVTNTPNVRALEVNGDVNINGDLAFSGAFSIGQLTAYYASEPIESMTGSPQNLHGLISAMVAQENTTVVNADAIGVNTAMLITLEENSNTTSGALGLGFAALALPCVVETHTGSYIDYMTAAAYAVNLAGSSTGGTIDTINLCRGVVIPNGITTINALRAYQFDLPFGSVATDTWGLHIEPTYAENYLAGSLNIGNASHKVSNSTIAFEIGNKKQMVMPTGTGTERDANTPVNGSIWANTTTNKIQGYINGAWVDLH